MSIEWATAILALAIILVFISANSKGPHAPA